MIRYIILSLPIPEVISITLNLEIERRKDLVLKMNEKLGNRPKYSPDTGGMTDGRSTYLQPGWDSYSI